MDATVNKTVINEQSNGHSRKFSNILFILDNI